MKLVLVGRDEDLGSTARAAGLAAFERIASCGEARSALLAERGPAVVVVSARPDPAEAASLVALLRRRNPALRVALWGDASHARLFESHARLSRRADAYLAAERGAASFGELIGSLGSDSWVRQPAAPGFALAGAVASVLVVAVILGALLGWPTSRLAFVGLLAGTAQLIAALREPPGKRWLQVLTGAAVLAASAVSLLLR